MSAKAFVVSMVGAAGAWDGVAWLAAAGELPLAGAGAGVSAFSGAGAVWVGCAFLQPVATVRAIKQSKIVFM